MMFVNTICDRRLLVERAFACFGFWLALAGVALAADRYAPVSHDLAPVEQQYMRAFVDKLPVRTQALISAADPVKVNLVVIDASGEITQVHTNRPKDAANVTIEPAEPQPDADSDRLVLPPCHGPFANDDQGDYNPGCNSKTGPYRRVYTKAAPTVYQSEYGGNYEESGVLTIACKAGKHSIGNGDGANAYLGGWSTTPNAKYGNVDAGLQYNLDVKEESTDSYSPFINIAEYGYVKYKGNNHIACSGANGVGAATARLSFQPAPWYVDVNEKSLQTVALLLTVEPAVEGDETTIITWVSPVPTQTAGTSIAGGWGVIAAVQGEGVRAHAPCTGCVFKWMTSIGQIVGKANYRDGATYAATWSDRAIAGWSSTSFEPVPLTAGMIFCSEYPLWFGTYNFGTRDCTSTPAAQNGIAKAVSVKHFSPGGETDVISLSPKN